MVSLPKSPMATGGSDSTDQSSDEKDDSQAVRTTGREMFLSNFSMPQETQTLESEMLDVHLKSLGSNTDVPLRKHLSAESIYIGRKNDSVDILMNSANPSPDKMDYESALMACIVAASIDRSNFVATTKMVAGQLIAQGRLQEGVQLLCLIGKASDACKFMISESKWADAAWLANVALEGQEQINIMSQWTGFLHSEGFQGRALEVAVSIWDIHRVLDMLARSKSWEHAALVLRALNELGYKTESKQPSAEKNSDTTTTESTSKATAEGDDDDKETQVVYTRGSFILNPVQKLCSIIHDNYKEYLDGVLHIHGLL